MSNSHLRAIILKIQDRLSEDDRKRLHFFLGNDVPRRVRDDPSLGGTLCLMESLFDQDKINEQDFSFLVNAFDEIHCLDAAKVLREHMIPPQSNNLGTSVQSLSVIMPPLLNELFQDEDKYSVRTHLNDQTTVFGNNNTIISHKNPTNNPMPFVNNSQSESFLPSKNKYLSGRLSTTKKYLRLAIILSVISIVALICSFIFIISTKIKPDKQLEKNEASKDKTIKRLSEKVQILEEKLKHNSADRNDQRLKNTEKPLEFRFNTHSSISHWSCIHMRENTSGWENNYLCTNRDIGLIWHFNDEYNGSHRKCVALVEPTFAEWNNNFLCLPTNSEVELVWSLHGSLNEIKCISLAVPGAHKYFHDNYLCWKDHETKIV